MARNSVASRGDATLGVTRSRRGARLHDADASPLARRGGLRCARPPVRRHRVRRGVPARLRGRRVRPLRVRRGRRARCSARACRRRWPTRSAAPRRRVDARRRRRVRLPRVRAGRVARRRLGRVRPARLAARPRRPDAPARAGAGSCEDGPRSRASPPRSRMPARDDGARARGRRGLRATARAVPRARSPTGAACRPVVTTGGRESGRVDVGAWAALALGVDGGPGRPRSASRSRSVRRGPASLPARGRAARPWRAPAPSAAGGAASAATRARGHRDSAAGPGRLAPPRRGPRAGRRAGITPRRRCRSARVGTVSTLLEAPSQPGGRGRAPPPSSSR